MSLKEQRRRRALVRRLEPIVRHFLDSCFRSVQFSTALSAHMRIQDIGQAVTHFAKVNATATTRVAGDLSILHMIAVKSLVVLERTATGEGSDLVNHRAKNAEEDSCPDKPKDY